MANNGDNDLEQVSLIQNNDTESISSYGSETQTKEEPYENILSLIGNYCKVKPMPVCPFCLIYNHILLRCWQVPYIPVYCVCHG